MTPALSIRPIDILLVEDCETDLMMTREALKSTKLLIRLHAVEDGVEALEFLRRKGKHREAPRPDLIMLDLNLPRKSGHEVLGEIKADSGLCSIPVVILTSSKAEEDVAKAYHAHANCYISKPVGFVQFTEVVRSIEHFWFTVVVLPHRDSHD
jgi:CheY-like chemotaxis protein